MIMRQNDKLLTHKINLGVRVHEVEYVLLAGLRKSSLKHVEEILKKKTISKISNDKLASVMSLLFCSFWFVCERLFLLLTLVPPSSDSFSSYSSAMARKSSTAVPISRGMLSITDTNTAGTT